MNHYQHHIGDYLRKTLGLSMLREGAYRRAIDLYYAEERPLPLKPDVYESLRCQGKGDRDAVDYILGRYFIETAAGFRHERCDEELAKYAAKSAKATASADARWSKTHSDGNANAMRTHSDGNARPSNANHEPVTNNQEPEEWKERSEPPTPEAGTLPGTLTATTWKLWKQHLADKRKGMSPPTERLQLAQLRGHADAESIVQNAIRNGHLRLEPVGGWPDKRNTVHDRRAATAAAMYGNNPTTVIRDEHEPTDITADSQRIA